MNCKKCGLPLEDGLRFCENCGAPVEDEMTVVEASEEVHIPEYAVVEASAPEVTQEQPFELNTAAQTPKKKPLLKPLLIGIGVVLLGLVVVAALNFSTITNWFLVNFGSAEDIFQQVETQNMEKTSDLLTAAYSASLTRNASSITHMTGDVHIKLGDVILNSAKSSMTANGVSMDMDWLSDILLRMDVNYREEGYRVNVGMGFGEQVVLSMDVLQQTSTGQVWVALPELNEQYITSASSTVTPGMAAYSQEILQILPAPESVNRMLDRYLHIPLSYFSDVTKDTDTVTVDDLEREVTVLTAHMTEAAAAQMAIEILETAREDQDLKSFFDDYSAFATQYAQSYGDTEEQLDFYEQFQASVDDELEFYRQKLEDASSDKAITWIVYLDAETGNIVGRKLLNSDEELVFDFLLLTEDSDMELSLTVEETEAVLIGEYEKNGFEGTLTVNVSDELALEAKMSDITETTGTVKLKLGAALTEALDMDPSLTAMTFEITARGENSADVKVMMGGLEFVTVTVDTQIAESAEITFPEKALDVDSNADNYTWIMGMDFDPVLNNLKKAGVPDALIQGLKQSLDQALGHTSVQ